MNSASQVPVGYKQTEVGVIPEEWDCAAMGDIGESLIGLTYSPNDVSEYGILVLRSSNVQNNQLAYKNNVFVDMDLPKRVMVKAGDILICVRNGSRQLIGKCALIDGTAKGAAFGAFMSIYRSEYSRFLFYQFQADVIKKQIEEVMGATINQITNKDLASFNIPLPPTKTEQTAIANALSDADAWIQSLTRLIAKKRQIKQGTMQTLLVGKKRLPEFVKSKNYKHTDVGLIPEDWDCVAMGDIGQGLIGLTYSPNDVQDYGTLVLRSSNVQNGQLAFDNNVFVDMDLPKRVMVEAGDILICVRNGSRQLIGKCALIDERVEGAAFGAFMSLYRSKFSAFVFYQFKSNAIKKQIEEVMGATINQITNKDLSAFKIAMPKDEDEQAYIVSVLTDMDTEITALETKLKKAQQIKQGMMQNLLTGRIRLVSPQKTNH